LPEGREWFLGQWIDHSDRNVCDQLLMSNTEIDCFDAKSTKGGK
jgi:hypothetical protein